MRKTSGELNDDSPLEDLEKDRLGYAHFAEHLSDTIVNRAPSGGYTISIQGDWGSGKSTILNFLQSQLDDSGEDPIVVRFNPWWFSGQPQLIEKFFEELGDNLGKEEQLEDIRPKLASLSEKLSKVPVSSVTGHPVEQAFGFIASLASEEEASLGEIKQEIDELLQKSDQPIVVFIDDIDRLNPQEISQMFQLVKSVADFQNVIYVLAFDRSVVVDALEREDSIQDGGQYLQKIVQLPLPIPDPKEGALESLFLDRLEHTCTNYDYDEVRWRKVLDSGILPILSTPRDVVRLVNTIEILSGAVGEEVNFIDLVELETLRVFHRDIYESIRSKPERFLKTQTPSLEFLNEDESEEDYSDLFEGIEDDKDAVEALIQDLFPQVEARMKSHRNIDIPSRTARRADNRISAPERFPVYFRLSIPEGMISEAKMGAILSSVTEPGEFESQIQELSQTEAPSGDSMAHNFFYRLSDRTHELSGEMVGPLLVGVFSVIDDLIITSKTVNRGTFLTECRRVVFTTLKNIEREERGKLLSHVISNGSSPYFSANLLAGIQSHHDHADSESSFTNETVLRESDIENIGAAVAEVTASAADDGKLLEYPNLRRPLRYWAEYGDENEASDWVTDNFKSDWEILEFIDLMSEPLISGNTVIWKFDPRWTHPYFTTEELRAKVTQIEGEELSHSDKDRYKRAQKAFEMLDNESDPSESGNWI